MAWNFVIYWNFRVPSNPILWLHWTSLGQLLGSHWLLTLSPHPQGSKGRKAGHGGHGQPQESTSWLLLPSQCCNQGISHRRALQHSPQLHSFEAHPLLHLGVCRGQGSSRPGASPPWPHCYMAVPHTFSFHLTHCRASILLHLILAFAEAPPAFLLIPAKPCVWALSFHHMATLPPTPHAFVLLANAGTNIRGPKTFSQAECQGTIKGWYPAL